MLNPVDSDFVNAAVTWRIERGGEAQRDEPKFWRLLLECKGASGQIRKNRLVRQKSINVQNRRKKVILLGSTLRLRRCTAA